MVGKRANNPEFTQMENLNKDASYIGGLYILMLLLFSTVACSTPSRKSNGQLQNPSKDTASEVEILVNKTSDEDTNDRRSVGERSTGVVKWFDNDKGYGFIIPDEGGQDLFVHYSYLRGDGFRSLKEGQIVEFTIGETDKGPSALDVVITGEH